MIRWGLHSCQVMFGSCNMRCFESYNLEAILFTLCLENNQLDSNMNNGLSSIPIIHTINRFDFATY